MTRSSIIILLCLAMGTTAGAKTVTVPEAARKGDATEYVRAVFEQASASGADESVRIVFPKGTYHFYQDNAFGEYQSITNHTNGYKYIGLNIEGLHDIEVDGQGSEFIFHGQMMPVSVSDSRNVRLKNFSIDWETPFFVQGEITGFDMQEEWYELRMYDTGYSWTVENERLRFPVAEGPQYTSAGEGLLFDKVTHGPVYGAGDFDMHRKADVRAVRMPSGNIRFYEKLKAEPPLGSVFTFKGPMGENRYAPAIHCINSENVQMENVNVYHALGMGFLGEKSTNITLREFNVIVRTGSDRMLSATADATHFCNCKGDVLVEKCRFENMLDDGTNVHGTYAVVDEILSANKIRVRLQHVQQGGFHFGGKGDEVWLILSPSIRRGNDNRIADTRTINDYCSELTFEKQLPEGLKKGDLVENKTWNTSSFVLRDCVIRNHRARSIVLKTPGKVVIENNYLQSMMPAVLIRGEALFWYESGASENVTIRGNQFENCCLGSGRQGIIHIEPRLRKDFSKTQLFDRNITIEENVFRTFDNSNILATRVDGLTIRDNEFIQDKSTYRPFNPDKPLIEITQSDKVAIEGNTYRGDNPRPLMLDAATSKNSTEKNNNWKK